MIIRKACCGVEVDWRLYKMITVLIHEPVQCSYDRIIILQNAVDEHAMLSIDWAFA